MFIAIGIFVVIAIFGLIYYNRDTLYIMTLLEVSSKKGDQAFETAIGKLLEYNPSNKKRRQYFTKKLNLLERLLKTYRGRNEISENCLLKIKEKITARKQELCRNAISKD
ncbi:MAG: hypothetical protein KAJ48_10880 [Elusimicrobiales bacterium]|nr:hypothetical protein [Elusimicrobiales bacterium]